MPPGPVVTLTTAGLPCHSRVAFRGHRTRLLMVHVCVAQTWMATERMIQKHRTTAGHAENLFDTSGDQPVRNLLRDGMHLKTAIEDQIAKT